MLGINQTHVIAAYADAVAKAGEITSAMSSNVSKVVTLVGDIMSANATIAQAVHKSKLAAARLELDAAVEQSGFPSQLTLSRRYHHYDFWRARALLENARRLSAASRRAIEGRFAVNMSEMKGDEPFVSAPSLWADEIYEYDLDAPRAVGLSVTPTSPSDGLYPNKLSDYVGNLENFVRGYSVKRPTASGIGDAEVVTITGPEVKETFSKGGNEETIVAGGATGWAFQCEDGGPWTTNPAAMTAGSTPINWSFTKNSAAPFENAGYGPSADLEVVSGTFGTPAVALGGKALKFSGSSFLGVDATEVGESTGGFTALTWVNLQAYNATKSVILAKSYHESSWTSPWFSVGIVEDQSIGTGGWTAIVNIDGTNHYVIVSGTPIPLKEWVQLGVTFDGRVARAYLNGDEANSLEIAEPQEDPVPIDWNDHGEWYLGGAPDNFDVNGWIGPTLVDGTAYSAERIAEQYQKTIKQTKPSVAWQFKESGAPFENVGSAGELPLTVATGTPTAGQSGPNGLPSVDLDGDSYLTTAGTLLGESPSEITLSAWVYVRNPTSEDVTLVLKSYNDGSLEEPYLSVGVMESWGTLAAAVTIAGTVNGVGAGTKVPRNQWSHVAMTFNSSTVSVFLNGAEKDSTTVSGAPAVIDWGDDGEWLVGGGFVNLDGMIADVRVEPRARSATEIADLYYRGLSGACYFDDACVGNLDCCPGKTEDSPLRTMCNGAPPSRAKVTFQLDPWGRQNDYYANPPYTMRHNVRWGRMAVNLVGVGVRDCSRATDATACYAESFLRYNLSHTGPTWVSDYNGDWLGYGLPIGRVEGGKALAIEEWIDPIVNGWNQSYISAVQRHEFRERPLGGAYELELEVTPDVRLDRIERVQMLMETNYWVRQQ